jgi:hypothetical protein
MDSDPKGPKTYGSYGSGSAALVTNLLNFKVYCGPSSQLYGTNTHVHVEMRPLSSSGRGADGGDEAVQSGVRGHGGLHEEARLSRQEEEEEGRRRRGRLERDDHGKGRHYTFELEPVTVLWIRIRSGIRDFLASSDPLQLYRILI